METEINDQISMDNVSDFGEEKRNREISTEA